MEFNFEQVIDRKDTDSLKWDSQPVKHAMWVADMDFACAPAIQAAIMNRAKHPIYGYSLVPSSFFTSIQRHWLTQHKIGFDCHLMRYVNGVMAGLERAIDCFSRPGEKIVLLTPGYSSFYSLIETSGRICLEVALSYANGTYAINWPLLEQAFSQAKATMMILSNPHNPTGQAWDLPTLSRIASLASQHGVFVVSDEIHCDIIDPQFHYTSFGKVSHTEGLASMVLVSASKAFNLAGLQTGAAIFFDENIMKRYRKHLNPNPFGIEASIAAFQEGLDWLAVMNQYVADNKRIVTSFLQESLPELRVVENPATYLLWIDCSALTNHTDALCQALLKEGIWVSKGSEFHDARFIRLNVACSQQSLLEMLLTLRQLLRKRSFVSQIRQ